VAYRLRIQDVLELIDLIVQLSRLSDDFFEVVDGKSGLLNVDFEHVLDVLPPECTPNLDQLGAGFCPEVLQALLLVGLFALESFEFVLRGLVFKVVELSFEAVQDAHQLPLR